MNNPMWMRTPLCALLLAALAACGGGAIAPQAAAPRQRPRHSPP
ncbi:MAG: hypothetical protein Q7U73_13060 [Rubrivivax sp.]|nr:hypothetical protein [Rubrivivax sp.]